MKALPHASPSTQQEIKEQMEAITEELTYEFRDWHIKQLKEEYNKLSEQYKKANQL